MKKKTLRRRLKLFEYILDDVIERLDEIYTLTYGDEMNNFINETLKPKK